ncbi:SWIM zinc finger family protein [Streptomyces sp. CG1]|uniref:SWIM zinc finger family protein n=1 Tax=Streptomyces sp. CG1 TaxID=1287523 RepID=UPI0034E1DD41
MSLPPEAPTTADGPRPADAARRALRAARERVGTERAQASEGTGEAAPSAPGGGGPPGAGEKAEEAAVFAQGDGRTQVPENTEEPAPLAQADGASQAPADPADPAVKRPAGGGPMRLAEPAAARQTGTGPRPADAARAALRATVTAPSAAAERSAATASPAAAAAAEDVHPVPPAGPAAAQGGRPADVAREALRAARREAQRAEAGAAEAAARGKRMAEPGTGRGPRAGGSSADPAPHTSPVPGGDPRTARVKAARDMRYYLANAFRMPTGSDLPESDTPEDEWTQPPETTGDSTDRTEPDHPAPAPASPHLPATMAAPHRDTELRRTFPAFAPRAATAEGRAFAATWWGNAWADALEQGALDAKRVARGRGYADQGHVDAITVTPGLVLAYVRGSRPRPYRVQVRVRTLEDEDWARFLDTAADRPGHIAALLDKELPQSLADCGVPLLPGPGDLAPRCSCPDSGHPCKHAAALCYQTARLLDADPFVLLLLRGRSEKDLVDALSRRSAARAARAAQDRQPDSLPGVRATDALAPRQLPPLPPPLPTPPHPEQPPVYPAAPGGPDPFALDQLATDAAARAHALLATGHDPVGELTLWQDAVRLAAARPGSGLTATTRTLYATLATAVGRTPADLARAVAAWRQGGLAGLAVLEEAWDPPAGRFDRARPLLLAADLPAFRPWRNRLTHPRGHVQLRLGHDGLWYAYESEPGQDDWWPRGTPDLDPVGALTGLGTPDDL